MKEAFKYWYDNFFADFRVPGLKMFTWQHIVLTIFCLTLMAILITCYVKCGQKGRKRILYGCAIFLFCLEAFRIIWHICYRGINKYTFPAHLCTLVAWTMPFAILFIKKQWLYNLMFLCGLAGGFIAMFVPLWVFGEWNVFHVMPVQSMLSHAMLMTIPIMLVINKTYIPRIRKYWSGIAGTFILWSYALILSLATGICYMLTTSSAGIPLLEKIPAPWHLLIVVPAFMLATYLFYLPFELYYRKKDMEKANHILNENFKKLNATNESHTSKS